MLLARAAGQLVADFTFYSPSGAGPWGYYGSPWNAGASPAVHTPIDYWNRGYCSSVAAGFPNHTVMVMSWPTGFSNGVRGQMAVSYGDYLDTHPDTPITAQKVNAITTLSLTHDVSYTFNEYNLIYDIFLTNTANNSNDIAVEIEIFSHMPSSTATYVSGRTSVGSTTVSGIAWTITREVASTIYIFPTNLADVNSATIDANALLAYLITQSAITGNEYYNGHNFGPEPINGDGVLRINSLSVSYS